MNAVAGLAGRIGVVTGAASGLGRAIAEQFAASGGTVIVADLDACLLYTSRCV